jgi:phage-related protein
MIKELVFLRGSLRRLKAFPSEARRESGHQLWLVQEGQDPDDWRPMQTIGAGTREIRIHDPHEHQVIYVAQFPEAVFVLHAFEKKTRRTRQHDIDIARAAYAEVEAKRQEHTKQ